MLAPICLFTYNRLSNTQDTVSALQKNYLASSSDLYVFSDGGKDDHSWTEVLAVRNFICNINGFKSVTIIESSSNQGLATSIISGVTQIVEKYGKVIVLEDDLITSRNFLDFMNQSLDFYENQAKVLSISGYSFSHKHNKNYCYDVNFGYRASSWGWGVWKDRWDKIDWEVKSYNKFRNSPIKRTLFNRGGSDLSQMLDKQMSGKLNSWAIRFCYHQFINQMVDVYPVESKVTNIGFGSNSTNTKKDISRFRTKLDCSNKRTFIFTNAVKISILSSFCFYWRYSLTMRILNKFF
jgi:hypothetical protein